MKLIRAYKLYRAFKRIRWEPHMGEKLKSRKFWVMLGATVLVTANSLLGNPIPDAALQNVLVIAGGWLGVQGIVDIVAAKKSSK